MEQSHAEAFRRAHVPEYCGSRDGVREWRGNTTLAADELAEIVPPTFEERYREPDFRVFVSRDRRSAITYSAGALTLETFPDTRSLEQELGHRLRIEGL